MASKKKKVVVYGLPKAEDGGVFGKRYGDVDFKERMEHDLTGFRPGMNVDRRDARQLRRKTNERIRTGFVGSDGTDFSQFARTRTKDFMHSGAPKRIKAQDGTEMPEQDGQMEEILMQVQQMLEQGAQPQEVIAQLLQSGIPPEGVMQIFESLGMPQEEIGPMIEEVMAQMQGGGAEEQPMMEDGGEQMEEVVAQVQQMLEQGAQPQEVIAQLLQSGIPPEGILQIFESMGIPQEEVGPMIEEVMAQMQGGQGEQGGQPMMQDGGEQGSQEEQIQQLIMMYSELAGEDPQAIMEMLSQAEPEQQEQMLQQMAQAVQEAQGGQQQMSPEQQMAEQVMARGGEIMEGMKHLLLPTKKDFIALKHSMLKELKDGGTSPTFDSASTENYIQNLHGAISNHVAKELRVGIINKKFDSALAKFDELPKAEDGLEVRNKVMQAMYGDSKTYEDLSDQEKKEVDNTTIGGQGSFKDYISAESSGFSKTDDDTVGNTIKKQQHYYPGRSVGGNTYNRPMDKSPIGQLFGAFSRQGTGNYNVVGRGDMQGMSPEQLARATQERMATDPNFQVSHGYLNRRGKVKSRPGLFGNRREFVDFQFGQNTVAPTGGQEVNNQNPGYLTDEEMSQLRESQNYNPNLFSSDVSNRDGRRLNREDKKLESIYNRSNSFKTSWDYPISTKKKYEFGGTTPGNPGKLYWDVNSMRFVPRAFDGMQITEEQEAVRNWGQAADSIFEIGSGINSFLERSRNQETRRERADNRSPDSMMPVFDTNSGSRGFYDQEGRFIGDDMGAQALPSTGDKNVYNNYGNTNRFQGLAYGKLGLEVGQVLDLTEQEIEMLQKEYGYKIKRK